MFADSFSVVSIQYVARGLRGCNIIAAAFCTSGKIWMWRVGPISYYVWC